MVFHHVDLSGRPAGLERLIGVASGHHESLLLLWVDQAAAATQTAVAQLADPGRQETNVLVLTRLGHDRRQEKIGVVTYRKPSHPDLFYRGNPPPVAVVGGQNVYVAIQGAVLRKSDPKVKSVGSMKHWAGV